MWGSVWVWGVGVGAGGFGVGVGAGVTVTADSEPDVSDGGLLVCSAMAVKVLLAAAGGTVAE